MSSRRLRISAFDHYSESLPLAHALHHAGHEIVPSQPRQPVDVLLIDLDPPPPLRHREMIDAFKADGAKVLLYPHGGGGPVLSYDGLWEPYENVDANLVTGVGHAEFLRRIEYPTPAHTIGWAFCQMAPFRPRPDVRKVLFAPTHPNADGSMADSRRELNAEIFRRLAAGPWQLTVRYIGELADNGLSVVDGVEFVNGRLLAQTKQIDDTDVVVAGDGTFPTLAIARGVPTVMYGQATLALGLPGEEMVPPQRAGRYMDYIRYPFDAADGPLDEVVHAAARSEAPIAEYKRRFVGRPFDSRAAVALIERIAAGRAENVVIDATRSFTTLAFADELLERPSLLRAYADTFTAADDASLILWAPGLEGDDLLALVEAAVAAAGLDADQLPDVLLTPMPGSPRVEAALAERCDARLSEWAPVGPTARLAAFGTADVHALRACALAVAAR